MSDISNGNTNDTGRGGSRVSSSTTLWPERTAFEAELPPRAMPSASPSEVVDPGGAGSHHRQGNHRQQQRRRMRPPRPGATSGVGPAAPVSLAGSGHEVANNGGVRLLRNGSASSGLGSVPGGAILVVDDLLDWSGGGDEGPAGGGDGRASGSREKEAGSSAAAQAPAACRAEWDGIALGREFLRIEGSALLKRYFMADGEVQRGR